MDQRRKASFKLYPTPAQAAQLDAWRQLHCELYNGALQERIDAYRKTGRGPNWYDQKKAVPQIRRDRPEFVALGSQAMEQTLKRLELAFSAFFRRVKTGQAPGFPRFKSSARYPGFAYPGRAGWNLLEHGKRGATLRVGSGDLTIMIRARGGHRFDPSVVLPNDLTLTKRSDGSWHASVTLRVSSEACARKRRANEVVGVDLGVSTWATFDDGRAIENPRFLREAMPAIAQLQSERARKRKGSIRYRRLTKRIAKAHQDVANARRDFIHKQTTALVTSCSVIATEKLRVSNMTRSARGTVDKPGSRVRQKAGLNREILSASFSQTHLLLAYKANEAGCRLHLCDTSTLKPSQRCAKCWAVKPKTLAQRVHVCAQCGHVADRDRNAASVMLADALTPRTGVTARPKPLTTKVAKSKSKTREELLRSPGCKPVFCLPLQAVGGSRFLSSAA